MNVEKQQVQIYKTFLAGFDAMSGTELLAYLTGLHDFMNKLPVGIWKQGGDRNFEWANRAFSRITGYGLEELVRLETMELIIPSWRQYVIARNKQILAGEMTGKCFFPARMKDGKKMIVMGTIHQVGNSLYGGYITPVSVDQEKEPVSGLLNEISFYREVRKIMKACQQNPVNRFTLMHIAVDRYERHLGDIGQFGIDAMKRFLVDAYRAVNKIQIKGGNDYFPKTRRS